MKRQNLLLNSCCFSAVGIAALLPGAIQLLSAKPTSAQPPAIISSGQTSTLYAQSVIYDPYMAQGLYALLEAQAWLKSTSLNTNGLRDEALALTTQGIQATQQGIQYSFSGREPSIWTSSPFYSPRAKVSPNYQDPDKIKLQKALTALQTAKSALQDARADKGGYRFKAISLADNAIFKTQRLLQLTSNSNNPDRDPLMVKALSQLKDVEQHLLQASSDKGGHRANALNLVRQAIKEVEKGMQYDRRN